MNELPPGKLRLLLLLRLCVESPSLAQATRRRNSISLISLVFAAQIFSLDYLGLNGEWASANSVLLVATRILFFVLVLYFLQSCNAHQHGLL
jgi:hypothetical protein